MSRFENDFEPKLEIFANGKEFTESEIDEQFNYIDISVQTRNNKKGWTVISNLREKPEKVKEFIQKAKKKLSCNGSVDENKNIRFNGEHKDEIADLLIKELNIDKSKIRIH